MTSLETIESLGTLLGGGLIYGAIHKVISVIRDWRKSNAESGIDDAAIKLAASSRESTDKATAFSERLLAVIEAMPKEFSKALDKQADNFRETLNQQDLRCDARTKTTLDFLEERFQTQTDRLHQRVNDLITTITHNNKHPVIREI